MINPVLAIDPGKRTGWAWSDGRCGTLDLSHCDDLGVLYGAFHDWLSDALLQGQARRLVIERAFGVPRFVADLPMVLTGIAHMVAAAHGVARSEVNASEIKRAVAGSGTASKRDVAVAVAQDGWAPDSPHAADAAAALMTWRARLTADATQPPRRREHATRPARRASA